MAGGSMGIERDVLKQLQDIYVTACRNDKKFFNRFVSDNCHSFELSEDTSEYYIGSLFQEDVPNWKAFAGYMKSLGFTLKKDGKGISLKQLQALDTDDPIEEDCEYTPYFEMSSKSLLDIEPFVQYNSNMRTISSIEQLDNMSEGVYSVGGSYVYRVPLCALRVFCQNDEDTFDYVGLDSGHVIYSFSGETNLKVIQGLSDLFDISEDASFSISPLILCKDFDIIEALAYLSDGYDDGVEIKVECDLVMVREGKRDYVRYGDFEKFAPMYGSKYKYSKPIESSDELDELYDYLESDGVYTSPALAKLYMRGGKPTLGILTSNKVASEDTSNRMTDIILSLYSKPIKEVYFIINDCGVEFSHIIERQNDDGEWTLTVY